MDILLRKIVDDEQGQTQLTDYELQADLIRIGSAPNSELQLLGPNIKALHAQLKYVNEQFQLSAEKGQQFRHNGQLCKQAQLSVHDEIEIDHHRLVLIEATPGFDLTLAWYPASVDGGLLANAYQTRLAQTELRARPIAWVALILIVFLAGLLPVSDYFLRTIGSSNQKIANTEAPSKRFVADSFWSSGPLHSAHKVAIGERCEACHEKAFVPVQDQACTNCHGGTTAHTLVSDKHAPLFAGQQCQNCHKEHNEPDQLTNRQDALCQSCHQNLEPKVKGFTTKAHPPFRLSLLVPEVSKHIGSLATQWQLEKKTPIIEMKPAKDSTTTTPLQENNHLKFSHQVHLNADKVRHANTDAQLQCGNCHQLSADREHFQPIVMEQQCISCHALSFDPNQPAKQLPHGDIATVYPTLEAHFVSLAFNKDGPKQVERRRLPAKTSHNETCKADFDCAKAKAIQENDRQFSQSGCVTCHQVEQITGVEAQSRWQLLPVRLTADWYPSAQFDHRSHLTQSGESENQLCSSCHKAFESTLSQDILIPAMDNCTQCHGDQSQSNKVIMQCVSCHQYHPQALLSETRTGSAEALGQAINALAAPVKPAQENQAKSATAQGSQDQ